LIFKNYEIMGSQKKVLGAVYDSVSGTQITDYRKRLYDIINDKFCIEAKKMSMDDNDYVYYSDGIDNSVPFYAVPKHSHGIGKFTPHFTLITENNCSNQNIIDNLRNDDLKSLTMLFSDIKVRKTIVMKPCNYKKTFSVINSTDAVPSLF